MYRVGLVGLDSKRQFLWIIIGLNMKYDIYIVSYSVSDKKNDVPSPEEHSAGTGRGVLLSFFSQCYRLKAELAL